MQKGFATLEIIFVLLIIAVLLSVAIPNAARIIDRAALDYETKRLYSELRFLQALSRSGTINTLGTGNNNLKPEDAPVMEIYPARRSWQILRNTTPIRPEHVISNGVQISSSNNKVRISFDTTGKSNLTSTSIILTSRYNKKSKIVFDSVGRFRGGRDDD